jgi:hypothetical protein
MSDAIYTVKVLSGFARGTEKGPYTIEDLVGFYRKYADRLGGMVVGSIAVYRDGKLFFTAPKDGGIDQFMARHKTAEAAAYSKPPAKPPPAYSKPPALPPPAYNKPPAISPPAYSKPLPLPPPAYNKPPPAYSKPPPPAYSKPPSLSPPAYNKPVNSSTPAVLSIAGFFVVLIAFSRWR